MRGGSRKAIAKNIVPIASAKIKMYATLSILLIPTDYQLAILVYQATGSNGREIS